VRRASPGEELKRERLASIVIGVEHVIVLVALHGALRDVADQVGRHGYVILFALIAAESLAFPLPGEVSLLVGAYEAQRGVVALPWVIVVGIAAAITGDNLAYLVGRTAGRPVVERLLRRLRVPRSYLDRMDSYYGRHAAWTILAARQISPVRGLAAFSAGSTRVAWRRFFGFNATACVVWATAVTIIAALFVRRLDALADDLSLAGLAVLAVALLVGAVTLWRRVRRRVGGDAAGSPGDWDAAGSTSRADANGPWPKADTKGSPPSASANGSPRSADTSGSLPNADGAWRDDDQRETG
jgi:membrane protein DedA with SNARE-associated domain